MTAPAADRAVHALVDQIDARAAEDPDRLAVIGDGFQLTRAALDQRASRLAHLLRERGVTAETRVAVCVERSAWLPIAMLAVLKSGGAWLPLDPDHPDPRLALLVRDAGAALVLAEGALADRFADLPAPVLRLDALPLADHPAEILTPPRPGDLAYVMYTSGSTGRPRGVLIEHGTLSARLPLSPYGRLLGPDDTVAGITAVSWNPSIYETLFSLARGARVALAYRSVRRDPERLAAFLDAHAVTFIRAVPSLFRALLDAGWRGRDDLTLVTHGEPLPPALADDLRPLGRRLWDTYGATEASVFSLVDTEPGGSPVIREASAKDGGLQVLDDALQPVPPGGDGEIHISGPVVARGYLNAPEATAARFLTTPEGRLYKTGDRARVLPDGGLRLLGRTDHQVKIRGQRIELGEIEATLGACPGVRRAAVVARADGGEPRLVGYIVGQPEADPREWLATRLPAFLVPGAVVRLDALPLNANGKVDRDALPAPERPAATAPPRTGTEALLAGLWADLLDLPEVGVDDDFLALGGHSLVAARVGVRLEADLGVALPLEALFEHRTVRALARVVDARRGDAPRPPLPRSDADRGPLSFAQERLWFLHRMATDDPAYNLPVALRLTGELDADALQDALDALVRRHEPLRTRFVEVDGVPTQEIRPADEARVLLTREAVDAASLDRRLAALALAPFDLSRAPQLRAHLFRQRPREHVLLLNAHHIASDGWSQALLRRELGNLYDHHRAGRPAPAPPAARYLDFARWQRAWLTDSGELDCQLGWWRQRLAGAAPLELPADHPRPPVFSSRAARETAQLAPALVAAARDLANRHGATLFMVLLAAFDAVLFRYTGQQDVCVGAPIAGRVRPETEDLVGFFVNTLVMRTEVRGERSFADLLADVRSTTLSAFDHQDLPFEHLVAKLNPTRDPSRHPLVQVVLALQNTPVGEAAMNGLTVERLPIDSVTTRFDVELHLRESAAGLRCELLYSRALFEPWRMAELLRHLEAALTAVTRDPDVPVARIPLLSEAERRRLTVEWNATEASFPDDRCLHELFATQAARTPDGLAVGGARPLTYAALDAASDRLAAALQARGVRPGARVGLALDRGPELIVMMLAALKAGAAYVPLDPGLPGPRLRWMAEDAGVVVVVTTEALADALGALPVPTMHLDLDALPAAAPDRPVVGPSEPAYVIYTSGSTGRPKGVAITHRGVVNLAVWQARAQGFGPSDRASQVANPSFDAADLEIWPALLSGASLHAPDADTARVPARLLAWLDANGVTVAFLPTPLFELCVDGPWPDCLRYVNVGGAALHKRPPAGLPFSLVNLYGPTECTVVTTSAEILPGDGPPPIGRPIANARVWVLDAGEQLAPVGVPGELCVGGVGLAVGYLNRPDLTAARFCQGPDGSVMFRTGDRARWWPDGQLEFLGRLDHQVKLRGYRIELDEIDSVLSQHPVVVEAVTALREDAVGQRLVTWVVPDRSADDALFEPYVDQWRALYDDAYAGEAADPTFDTRGWNSSFTGAPIPAAHMREWVDTTVAAVRALRPRRVLEIGCGTGLLLYRLAPDAEAYGASDLSAQAVEALRARRLTGVDLHVGAAHDLAWLGEATVDTVILNSVVQYFPGAAYLERVIEAVLPHVTPGGAVFLGDIRDLARLQAFHREIERARSGDMPPAELDRRAAERAARDKELLLDRAWFEALPERFSAVVGLEILPKRGAAPTEMNRYRYDVVLRVGEAAPDVRGPSPSAALASDPLADLRARRLRPALQAHLAAWLPEYMLPADWVFLDALPTTRSGKVDRAALPPPRRPRANADEAPPRTDGERAVAEAFAQALGLSRVGVRDNFFALGGHSLLAVQVVSRLHERLGVDVPLTTLFAEPTVEALARFVDGARSSAPGALDSDTDADIVPMTATDLAFHYGKQVIEADADSWYQVLELRTAPLDVDRLRAAVLYTVEKHPLLRGCMSRTDTFGSAVYWDARRRLTEAPLDVERAADAGAVERVRERLVATPLPIDRAPSCRFTLVRAPGTDHVLLRYHHGAVDASGLLCLLDSLMSRYLGRPDPVRRVLPFTTAELLAHYAHGRTSALDNNEVAHLAGALPGGRGPGWLKTGMRFLERVRTTQIRGQGGRPGDKRTDALELDFTPEQAQALDAVARERRTTLDRVFLVGFLTGATQWNRERGEQGRLEAYWAVNLRPPRYLRSVVANQFAWSRVRVPVESHWDAWRREMLDPAADFLLRGALDWIQAIEGFDRKRMPDFVRRRFLKAARGLNPALFISNTATVSGLADGALAAAMGVRSAQLHSRFGATDKPVLVIRRDAERLGLRMIYPLALFDPPGAHAFLTGLMQATLALPPAP